MASIVAAWPTVALGEVLRLDIDAVPVDASAEYLIAGVYSFGRGLLSRAPLAGTETTYKVLHRLHTDHFVLSQLKAWEGALARVPSEFDGWFLSPQFPTFCTVDEKLDVRYLEWYCKQASVWEQLRNRSRGMGARRDSVSPTQFLSLPIPLPPLDEQRRIVARIEELAARIGEARGLRREAATQCERLSRAHVDAVLAELNGHHPLATVENVSLSVTDGDHQPPPRAQGGLPFILISNITSGKLDLSRCDWVSPEYFASLSPTRVPERGDVLYAAVGATYGTPCLVDTDQRFCFQRHIAIIKPDRQRVLPKYLWWALSSEAVYAQASAAVTGSAQPTVPLRGIRKLQFPLPPLSDQESIVRRLDDVQSRIDTVKRLQAESRAELDALLPSVLDRAFRGEL